MLILGIETATEQVSVALGGHEGVIGLFEVARGRRHAEILTPAIEFVCAQADIGLDEIGLVAVDVGPGLFTGMRVGLAAGKALAQALRVPMIGISSLDLLAFPHRRSDRVVVPVIDARKGEVFYAMYRQVPGGLQQVVAPRVGPVDELVADLLARSQEALCVGDGALRYRAEILDGFHCEIADDAHPSAGPLVQLAHARALREEWVTPADIRPVYLRQPDAQINWADAGQRRSRPRAVDVSVLRSRFLERPAPAASSVEPMRHRHVGQVLAIERAAYPKPWSARCSTTSSTRRATATALPRRPPRPGRRRLRRADVRRRRGPRHEHRRPPRPPPRRHRHAAARRAGRRRHPPRLRGVDARGAGQQHGRPGAVPRVRLRAGRRPGRYYEGTEDAIVMWCHDIQTPAYARRLGELCADDR